MNKLKLGWNKDFKKLALSTFCMSVCFAIHSAIFNNFIVDELGIQPQQFGTIESLRETPGFLTAAFAGLAMRMSTPKLAGAYLIIMGIGMGSYALARGIFSLIASSIFWSLGFHCWMPLRETMALNFSDEQKGRRLGELRSVDSIGAFIAFGIVYLVVKILRFRITYMMAGSVALLGGLVSFFIIDIVPAIRLPRFTLKKQYGIYYILMLLQGCRRQIFMTFAIFALVREYQTSVQSIAALMFINTVVNLLLAPTAGKIVDRIGERKSLSISFIGLAFIFWGYASFKNRYMLYSLYCIDNLVFLLGIAMTTYLNKIAKSEDLRATLSMGITMDHVAAVIMPIVGGLLWESYSYRLIFQIGSVIALISLAISQKVTDKYPKKTKE